MNNRNDFDERIGRKIPPIAGTVSKVAEEYLIPVEQFKPDFTKYKVCSISPKQGCYRLTFQPVSKFGSQINILGPVYKGTLRFEDNGDNVVISADLYKFKTVFPMKYYQIPEKYNKYWGDIKIKQSMNWYDYGNRRENESQLAPARSPFIKKKIPIYARSKYFSYLQGVSAQLVSIDLKGQSCFLSITFDEFFYNHPATGFDGSFPNIADRTVQMRFDATSRDDCFTGSLYEGNTKLGNITLEWVSSYFRRAELKIHQLEGSQMPQPVSNAAGTGTEDFSTIFEDSGWSLTVTRDETDVALPASLNGVQDPNSCWSHPNMHDLMDSLPGYDPAELDLKWKAYLVAIPATLGCSRGWMFDSPNSGGDVNDIDREGAVTQSHDGYPATDGVEYGEAEDDMQIDHPRAFLRSAAHEVGHTFNQIHQSFEGGNDNSIMTTTPSVANVLDGVGDTFPDDIDLAFNATVQRHLVHLPDPAVRPGGMQFFGHSISAPEADVNYFDPDDLELKITLKSRVKLGEPVMINWSLINHSTENLPVPEHISATHHVAHISVTKPDGSIRYMKPSISAACSANRITTLVQSQSRKAEMNIFWSRNGFAFETPGRHQVDVILLWEIDGLALGVRKTIDVWVDHPVSEDDNAVAALMLNNDVGRLIAMGDSRRNQSGFLRVSEVLKKYKSHEVCAALSEFSKVPQKRKAKNKIELEPA